MSMMTPTSSLIMPVSERDHVRGSRDAAVTLVEYGDYECPFCAAAHPIVNNILRLHHDDLLFAFRNFPLTEIHPHAETAARLAEAAGLEGKFWQMHDAIYSNHDYVRIGNFLPIAEMAGLELRRLAEVSRDEGITERLREDFMSGVRSGVNGTPTFFINGYRYNGDWARGDLANELQRLLGRQRAG
jgi:protein-disulfide isomerase